MLSVEGVQDDPKLFKHASVDIKKQVLTKMVERSLPSIGANYKVRVDYRNKISRVFSGISRVPRLNYYPFGVKNNAPLNNIGVQFKGMKCLRLLPIFESVNDLLKDNHDYVTIANYIYSQGFFQDSDTKELLDMLHKYHLTIPVAELTEVSKNRRMAMNLLKSIHGDFDGLKAARIGVEIQLARIVRAVEKEILGGDHVLDLAKDMHVLMDGAMKYEKLKNDLTGSVLSNRRGTSGDEYVDELKQIKIEKERLLLSGMQKNIEDQGINNRNRDREIKEDKISDFTKHLPLLSMETKKALMNQDVRSRMNSVLDHISNIPKTQIVDGAEYRKEVSEAKKVDDDELVFD